MRKLIVLGLVLVAVVGLAPAANAAPANDDLAAATEITTLPYYESTFTDGATSEPGEPDPCGLEPNEGTVWYRYTATRSGPLVVSTSGSSYDTGVTVYTGTSHSDLAKVVCEDPDDYSSRLPFRATQGETYLIQVGGRYAYSTMRLRFRLYAAGQISGLVTGEGVGPLAGICVTANKYRWSSSASTITDPTGAYTLNVKAGKYYIRFSDCRDGGWIQEWHANVADFYDATPVTVDQYTSVSGIDAELTREGTISGFVSDSEGKALDYICVNAYRADGSFAGRGYTSSIGVYRIRYLLPGEYRVRFRDCSYWDADYATEWHSDAINFDLASPVAVASGVDSGHIDAVLLPRTKPDVAVTSLTVERVPLESDVLPLPEGNGTDRRITFELQNAGVEEARYTSIAVRACPRAVGSCIRLNDRYVYDLEPGETYSQVVRWNAGQIAGDWTIRHHLDAG